MNSNVDESSGSRRGRGFATTRWSCVLAAGKENESASREALAELCRIYWYPLYAYVRRRGHSPQDAEDLTQEFFLQLTEKDWVARADKNKGRFRTFLLSVLNHFLANEWDKASRKKRGGHLRRVSLSMQNAEHRYSNEPVDDATPEQAFERQWALAVLDRVLAHLREEYAQRGQGTLFETLKPSLVGDRQAQPYERLAAELGMSVGSVKVAVHRLRRRYRERLLEEISQTVTSPDEAESELRHLFRALAVR